MSKLNLPDATEFALELLGKSGGIAVGETSSSANLRWANSALTTNGNSLEDSLSIAAFVPTSDGIAVGLASGQIQDR